MQGNLKTVLRLTTTVAPVKLVLGIRKAILDKAGVANFTNHLKSCGYEAVDVKNFRYFDKILINELLNLKGGLKYVVLEPESLGLRLKTGRHVSQAPLYN